MINNKVPNYGVDINVDSFTRQFVVTIMLHTITGMRVMLSYKDEEIANLVITAHKDIEKDYGSDIADHVVGSISDQYYRYKDLVTRYCNQYNIPFDIFVKLNDQYQFLKQMESLSYIH